MTAIQQAQALVGYLNARLVDTSYNQRQVPGNTVHFIVCPDGKKYARVKQGGAAYCFVDEFGNIYKAESWKKPAKGVRATVESVVNASERSSERIALFFGRPGEGFDKAAYSTGWLYR